MAQPWKDPRSGIYYIRRRVPKDVKPRLPQPGELYKRSLETTALTQQRIASLWSGPSPKSCSTSPAARLTPT
ncbi:DUF6538 domain-containing protein [Metapseudomonas otitidis]|uniref:DUF6538 domain-containing protein n=1 Tax=Metapseudomonas otitidis TaxID=319939 RepID=UPI00280C2073|nr:DUF6538 domain-containing protein [Pseudomonas otitidis]